MMRSKLVLGCLIFCTIFIVGCSQGVTTVSKSKFTAEEKRVLSTNPGLHTAIAFSEDEASFETLMSSLKARKATLEYVSKDNQFVTFKLDSKTLMQIPHDVKVKNIALNQIIHLISDITSSAKDDEDLRVMADSNVFMPLREIGAERWRAQYPNFDGRGVVVAVLDTGVTLDHQGLRTTSTGAPKIIDWQDFTGEGDLAVTTDARLEGGVLQGVGDQTLAFPEENNPHAAYAPVYVGAVEEAHYKLSRYANFNHPDRPNGVDFDNDGNLEDVFALVVLKNKTQADQYAVLIDSDQDNDLTDEVLMRPYKVAREYTRFGNDEGLLPVCITEISNDGQKVVLGFDDGGHGTHVAGIATGYGLGDGSFHGVAPGAQVMSLKIGDNRLSGGSTTTASMLKAMEYGATHGADVLNLSYGIDSAQKNGASQIDLLTNRLAERYHVLFSISAGNSGPGLTTVGIPAAASMAISSAAVLPKDVAASNYGWVGLARDMVWYFSSNGPLMTGFLKPTVASPGSALSSTPDWAAGHRTYSGTSMAAPQTTGGLALVLSAAKAENTPYTVRSVIKAVKLSAKPMEGESILRQGYGMLQVDAAYEQLKALGSEDLSGTYEVTHAYLRVTKDEVPRLTHLRVAPTFPEGTSDLVRSRYWKGFRLESSADWLTVPAHVNMNGTGMSIPIRYDRAQLQTPGLYTARVLAYNTNGERATPEFDMLHTIVVAHDLTTTSYRLTHQDSVPVGEARRLFIKVPAHTSSVHVDVSIPEGSTGRARGILFDPNADEFGHYQGYVTPGSGLQHWTMLNPDTGVWEVDVYNSVAALDPAGVDVSVQVYGLTPGVELLQLDADTGEGTVLLTNHFQRLMGETQGRLSAYGKTHEVHLTTDTYRTDIIVSEGVNLVTLKVQVDPQVYDMMTDFPIYVVNEAGLAVLSDVVKAEAEVSFETTEAGTYTLYVTGAFAEGPPEGGWDLRVLEQQHLTTSYPLAIRPAHLSLETGEKIQLHVSTVDGLPETPEGYSWRGYVKVKKLREDEVLTHMDVAL